MSGVAEQETCFRAATCRLSRAEGVFGDPKDLEFVVVDRVVHGWIRGRSAGRVLKSCAVSPGSSRNSHR